DVPLTAGRLDALLAPYQDDLARWPLYVSLDKDVMVQPDAVVNWGSGQLTLAEGQTILAGVLHAAAERLAEMGIVGDGWPVQQPRLLLRAMEFSAHPSLAVAPAVAARRNERTNLALFEQLGVM